MTIGGFGRFTGGWNHATGTEPRTCTNDEKAPRVSFRERVEGS